MKSRGIPVVAVAVAAVALQIDPANASDFELEFRQYDGTNLVCGFVVDVDLKKEEPVACSAEKSVSGAVGSGTVSWEGFAGPGSVRSTMVGSVFANPAFSGFGYGGCAVMRSVIDDILVSGPAGVVGVQLNVNIAGDAAGDTPRGTNHIVFTAIARSYTSNGTFRDSSTASLPITVPDMVDTSLMVGPFNVAAGDTLEVEFNIVIRAGVFANPTDTSNSYDLDFADRSSMYGMSFPESGPVFDLPAGFTVNSLDGNIQDNMWSSDIFFDGVECDGLGRWALVIP